VTVYTIL